jgi:hypothetical protein
MLDNLTNRGRRSDKHGRYWRVYDLNFMRIFQSANARKFSKKPWYLYNS